MMSSRHWHLNWSLYDEWTDKHTCMVMDEIKWIIQFEAASKREVDVYETEEIEYRMKIFGLIHFKGSKDSQNLFCIKIYLDII